MHVRVCSLVLLISVLPLAGHADSDAPAAAEVVLSGQDLVLDLGLVRYVLRTAPTTSATPSRKPEIDPADVSPAARLLRVLRNSGAAAGLAGVIYDNRDRNHSPLPVTLFPKLTRLRYAPDLIARNLDLGLADRILLPGIAFGNSSTAVVVGPAQRSLPRLAMTQPDGPLRAWQSYVSNQIYVYPEHNDHDAVDLFPANWPYMLVSQGSSHTDQPFLRAVGLILAAFRPDTRDRLVAEGLVSPTVQMVFRRAQTGVTSRADYLSGAAHPSVFDSLAIAPERMIALANSLTPNDIPPLVILSVLQEDFTGKAGLADQSERLFDTPSAIARVWRSPAFSRSMLVSAAATRDPNDRVLTFNWVLLRGDPTAVRIEVLEARGQTARISLDWQDRRPVDPHTPLLSDRVDIAVFAHNGVHDSAPGFVSVSFPTHQVRRYAPGPDGTMRLAEVDYDAKRRGAFFDPMLHWSAPWRDVYHHDVAGRLTGWTRIGGENPLSFGADGKLSDGRSVRYLIKGQVLQAAESEAAP